MDLLEFVQKVFNRYPPKLVGNDTIENITDDYINALDTGAEYDYDSAFIILMRTYDSKTLPKPCVILDALRTTEKKAAPQKYDVNSRPNLWGWKKNQGWMQFECIDGVSEYEGFQWLKKRGFLKITNKYPYTNGVNT